MMINGPELQKKPNQALALMSQVAQDIHTFLESSRDPQKGLNLLSRKTSLHEKTLRRLLQQEHRPGYITLFKLYRFLLGTNSDSEILDNAPSVVADFLKKANPKTQTPSAQKAEFSGAITEELKKDPVMLDLYFLAGCGPLHHDEVLLQMGLLGLKTIEKMKGLGLLEEITPRHWKLGSVQANLDADLLKQAALRLTENYFSTEASELQGENYLGVYAEGLNEQGLQEWLKIDEECFRRKVTVSQSLEFQGPLKVFTVQVTEQMNLKRNLK